ncbi:MAG: hypothetical protein WAW88_00915 [Nocardioides sp.]
MWWLLALIIVGVVVFKFRVQILARILGQPESRIQRQIDRKRH